MSATPFPTADPDGHDHPERVALRNVRVFDGTTVGEPTSLVLTDGRISAESSAAEARVIDGAGAVLLPGLIDAHIHLHDRDTLEQLCSWGVTTALDMATWSPELVASLRGVSGLSDIRSPGLAAIGPGGPHSRMPGMPSAAFVRDPAEAEPFVAARVAEGADYIKIVAEAPGHGGPDQSCLDALVDAAHARGKAVVAHAASTGAVAMALDAGADVLTHAPIDRPLPDEEVARIARTGRVVVPTLTMMEGTSAAIPGTSYDAARASVTALHRAGVPILAGTDANATPGAPFPVRHGTSLHRELELLVDAGLRPVEALRAATSAPAERFGLSDRGAITPGLRADLVLVDGDPTTDIRTTRNLVRIFSGGVEHSPTPVRDGADPR